ncbi:tetratricopeptide repeat protein 7B isoform X2 [Anthonomus grandis grandis]|uniref:tetratricopeptide repeat protein 7B isoform X2 n=1 Tax=Anthonomus grandis grandis TaxID=2921223 RepID=UPI002165C993|nr:tetratricopeptide repeat protein 7B isoform X2 [Anthonomus grandis grandis]
MTTRGKSATTRIEVEIEKNREDGNWLKVIELAQQLKEKSPDFVCLSDFLIGEGKLENFLEDHPPIDQNINKAKMGLIEAKRYLNMVITEAGVKAGVAMDAHLLLGKLHYACGQYGDALQNYKLADLQNLSEKKLPLRSLKIVAESYAIKGLCLQKDTSASSKFKKAEKQEEMARCFDLASDLGLLYMQNLDKEINSTSMTGSGNTGSHSPLPPGHQKALGEVLEQALQAAPVVLLQHGKADLALERYRNTLCAIEAHGINSIRLKFMTQLAELLLQGLVGDKYQPPINVSAKSSYWRPKYYASLNQFIPRCDYEEVILVLLIAESMAVKNAVLSQSPEFKDIRLSAGQDATTVYDLLTIATVRWGQIALLQESLERSMKFSFEDPHLWRQQALTLISIGNYEHALSVLREVIRLESDNASNCLLAAKLCYEHLNRLDEGIEFSQQAREMEIKNPCGLLSRCHLYAGIGYYLRAESSLLKKEQDTLRCKALDNLKSAVELEPNDHLARYFLGLQLAILGQISEAQRHIRVSLDLRPEHSSTLHLLALILTAERQFKLALSIVEDALEEYPDCLNLMYVKAHLELHEKGGEVALVTAKQMLELWKSLYEGQTISDMPECDRKSDTRSVFQLYTSEMSDKDSSSLQLHNIAATRVEQALSEVASSLSSFSPRPGPQRAWMLQVEVWLLLAELYLALGQVTDVQQCIQEAMHIYPLSHHIMHMKGLLHMHKEEWTDAQTCFQNAVAINPLHVKSLQQLGLVYHYLGLQGLAETTLREAAKIEPHNTVTWYNLGKVLEALGEYEKASSAMATSLMEEKNNPILPFNSVPLCFE